MVGNLGKPDWKFVFAMLVICACGVWFSKEIDLLTISLVRMEGELDKERAIVAARLRTLGVAVRELEEKAKSAKPIAPAAPLMHVIDPMVARMLEDFKKAPPEHHAGDRYGKIKMETADPRVKFVTTLRYQTEDGTNWTVEMIRQPDGSYKCGKREK